MLNADEFTEWLQKHRIGQDAEKIIRRIRSSPPSRLVNSGRSNVTGRYPSIKMGQTIQFESHKVELAFIREYEFDEEVLEYYDQPGPIKITYQSSGGRPITAFTTPDFFVIRNDGTASWEECKTGQELVKLAEKSNRFCQNELGAWCCPSGEEYAARYGFLFRVRSSAEINWVWQRNIEYLSDYLQDSEHATVDTDVASFITALIKCKQGILLSELFSHTDRITPDDVFLLVARNKLYVDLKRYTLSEHDRTPIYTSKEYVTTPPLQQSLPQDMHSVITIQSGHFITWDVSLFEIVNTSADRVWLRSDNGNVISLDLSKLEELVRIGVIRGAGSSTGRDEIYELLQGRGTAAYAAANDKYAQIAPYLSGDATGRPTSTIYKWLKRYRNAELHYGCGYVGLIDNKSGRGNRVPKIPAESLKMLKACIDEQYMDFTRPTAIAVFGQYSNRCEQAGIIAASYKTVTTYLKSLDAEDTEYRRKGPRAAYQLSGFYWELDITTPRHGDRPFEIAHLDHTELDIELVDSVSGKNIGKPWLTLIVDAYSRRILAFFLSYEYPSYRSCMMVLRECVRKHNRLPQTIVVDGGSDFKSVYFEKFVAFNKVIKKTRPRAKPRFGSVLERLFGVANTQFIYCLEGNTQNAKNVRQVTKSVSPGRLAIWTFSLLQVTLGQYFEEVYDKQEHPALGESPLEAFRNGIAQHGSRPFRLIPYDDAFILSSLPSTPKGYAKIIQSRGVKINHIYYWHEAFRANSNTNVNVRYDPYDIGTAYAYVGKSWLACRSQYYAQLKGLTESGLRAISVEIAQRQRHSSQKFTINAQMIAAFIAETKGTEKALKAQKKAAEMKSQSVVDDEPEIVNQPAARKYVATKIFDTL